MYETPTDRGRVRICYIPFMFTPFVGGSEVQAEKQARHLLSLGHETTVVTLRHEKRLKRSEILDGLPVFRVGGIYNREGRLRIGKVWQIPIKIALFCTLWRLRKRYDLLHVFQLGMADVAAMVGKLAHKPVLVTIPTTGPGKEQNEATLMADTLTLDHDMLALDVKEAVVGDIAYFAKSQVAGKAILNFMRNSDAFYQVLSSRSRTNLISHGFRAQQIIHIPNGVDVERFVPNPTLQPDPANPARDIICVARLQYAKGIDVLLHAWGRMMRIPEEWRETLEPRLLLVGEGPLLNQFEHIATELGILESTEFMGLRRDVVALLQQSWGFVLPSRWEGMPNALLEAMACELPSVATRVSGSEDIITHGVDGLLVEPEDPAELANALQCIVADTGLARSLAKEGRLTVLRNYQLTAIVEQCLELYHKLLEMDREEVTVAMEGAAK